jgi:predicted nucleotidyltransferase
MNQSHPPITPMSPMDSLTRVLSQQPSLEFAVLVGSRASGSTHAQSDWDIALQWAPQLDWLAVIGAMETLRENLAQAIDAAPSSIDLIELRRANLAMRASVAEEGVLLYENDSLAWMRFLQRTWRELEDFYWDKNHAA